MTYDIQNLFTTDRSITSDKKTSFSIPNIKLLRAITQIRLQAEQHIADEHSSPEQGYQYYGILAASLLDMVVQFDDLSHALDLVLSIAKTIKQKYPQLIQSFIEKIIILYHDRPHPQPITTRLAYSRLKMFLAQFRLELGVGTLVDIRATVFHCIPIIQELNFITVLINAGQYRKGSLFLHEIAPLFEISDQIDIRIALPYYELVCLANLGVNMYKVALEALDKGKNLIQESKNKSFRASRFITLFEKVVTYFEKSHRVENEKLVIDELKMPGVIFDKIFLHSSMCKDPEGILVEI